PPFSPGELSELDEQEAAGFGKRSVAKALGIEEVGTGGPVTVFIGEHALQYENLFSLRMVVRRQPRLLLVAHNRRDHACLWRRRPSRQALPLDLASNSSRAVSTTARTERSPLIASLMPFLKKSWPADCDAAAPPFLPPNAQAHRERPHRSLSHPTASATGQRCGGA